MKNWSVMKQHEATWNDVVKQYHKESRKEGGKEGRAHERTNVRLLSVLSACLMVSLFD